LGFASVRVGDVIGFGMSGGSSCLLGDLSGFISIANSFSELAGRCKSALGSDGVECWRPIVILGFTEEGLDFLFFRWEVVREKRTRAERRSGSVTRSTSHAPEVCR
jgi:hypothetical protein